MAGLDSLLTVRGGGVSVYIGVQLFQISIKSLAEVFIYFKLYLHGGSDNTKLIWRVNLGANKKGQIWDLDALSESRNKNIMAVCLDWDIMTDFGD